VLSNGQPHTVSLSVFNADNYFSATATLFLYTDPGSAQTTGEVTQNTLTSAPSPVVAENLHVKPSFIDGGVDVSSKRSFVIAGYVDTSHGTVTTKVSQSINFSNNQSFDINATKYVQNIKLASNVNSNVTVSQKGVPNIVYNRNYMFPLTVDITEIVLSNGDINQTTTAEQTYQLSTATTQRGVLLYNSSLQNTGRHVDTLELDSSYNLLGNNGQSSSQQYNRFDSTGAVYLCDIAAAANVLTAFSPGCAQ
jgi:hypothetical protein